MIFIVLAAPLHVYPSLTCYSHSYSNERIDASTNSAANTISQQIYQPQPLGQTMTLGSRLSLCQKRFYRFHGKQGPPPVCSSQLGDTSVAAEISTENSPRVRRRRIQVCGIVEGRLGREGRRAVRRWRGRAMQQWLLFSIHLLCWYQPHPLASLALRHSTIAWLTRARLGSHKQNRN